MTNIEKAEIILENLDKVLQINWNFKDTYIKAIINGLTEIQEKEKSSNAAEKN